MAAAMAGVNTEPFIKFAEFVSETKSKYIGHDTAENPTPYVPLSALLDYWKPQRIVRVLRAYPRRLNIDAGVIRRSYLRIFSTLVYTHHDTVPSLARLFITHNLTDEKLPWSRRPSEWPDEKIFRDYFDRIAEHQWQFFPLKFDPDALHDRRIDDRCILPIDYVRDIAQGSAASVRAFNIHPEFNYLTRKDKRDPPTQHTFVFKTYHGKRHEASYENEYSALHQLTSSDPSSNVVKFYGSLRQFGSYSLILEYADGGDLGEFFTNCDPPHTAEDVVMFWRSLFRVFSGLDRIHKLMLYGDDYIKGIHEDIRPENILLMKGSSASPYDFTPKIADFGLYSRVRTVRAKSGGSGFGLDHYGNQRFSSPECCHHTIERYKGINMIRTAADIFSIGAVLSHTAAWVVGGRNEQGIYLSLRKAYHETRLPRFKNSGYEGCFHDSIYPLPIIGHHHRKLLRCCQPSDDVTPKVLKWVEDFMLVRDPKDRLPAKDILETFEQFMDSRSLAPPETPTPPTAATDTTLQSSCWSVPAVSSPSTVDGVSPPAAAPTGVVASDLVSRPALQVVVTSHGGDVTAPSGPSQQREVVKSTMHDTQRTAIDSHQRAGSSLSSSSHTQQADVSQGSTSATESTVSSTAPGSQIGVPQIQKFKSDMRRGGPADPETARLVDYLEHNLGGRDQFFFIDDSYSMQAETKTISDGFLALACIAKRLDPNHVELAFASRPKKVYKAKRTRRLHQLVAGCKYKGEGHLMENRLGELIDGKIIPRLPYKILGVNVNPWARKKVSVYVFTDGDWGHAANSGDACGVERPVQRLIEELKKRRLDRTQVSLHFVRFGDKENGRKHLERLDDFGRKDGWDIVDVKHIKTAVAGMIIGPLTRANDDIQAT